VGLFSIPTLRLLNASTVVALSGAFRLHVAFLLAGLHARLPVYAAFSLIVYATYTLDRALECREDVVNRAELCGASRNIGLFACAVTFLCGAAILARDGIYLASVFPFIVGYLYTRGIRVGKQAFKLKGSAGMKNLVIGITWGGAIALVVSRFCDSLPAVLIIFVFYCLKLFVTSTVNDFKDVTGDLAAGIRTLPSCLGEDLTRKVLILILICLHMVMFSCALADIVRNEWIVLFIGMVLLVAFLSGY
jgi:4-hydroxybenzoate polyprenyltransferase